MDRIEIYLRDLYSDVCVLHPDNVYLQSRVKNCIKIIKDENNCKKNNNKDKKHIQD